HQQCGGERSGSPIDIPWCAHAACDGDSVTRATVEEEMAERSCERESMDRLFVDPRIASIQRDGWRVVHTTDRRRTNLVATQCRRDDIDPETLHKRIQVENFRGVQPQHLDAPRRQLIPLPRCILAL